MRIKKIELVGFKSFKDRTVILFDAGVTGIVGPNGCGKSNIVDAILWVMGEQSAKHLRGSSMEDVIFGGSEGYAPSGFAEVSMTLENTGGLFPTKYSNLSEIMVTRRLHRSGESEYLLNKEQARLKDIQEVFMDTGAGSKGFSIIEQGAIGKIITAKPIDRRVLIEEAAGITKFKVRKKESQRKLVSTDQNLLRLKDIILELKRQIDSLQRQAKKAERYKELKDKMEDLDLLVNSHQYTKMNTELEGMQKQHIQLSDEYSAAKATLASFETEMESVQLRLLEKEKQVEAKQLAHEELQGQVKQKETEIQRLGFEVEQAQRNAQAQGNLGQELSAKQIVLVEQFDKVGLDLAGLDQAVAELERTYQIKEAQYQDTLKRLETIGEEVTATRRELITVTQAKTQVEANIVTFTARLQDVGTRKSEIEKIISDLGLKKDEFEKNLKNAFNDLERERQMQLGIMNDVKNFEDNKANLQQQVTQKRQEVEMFKDELNQVSSRLYGLEDLQMNFEGFEAGVKSVMLWKKSQKQMHPDGQVSEMMPVAEAIEVPSEYEVAMEAALGPKLQLLLSESNEESLNALGYLKENRAGRSGFISQAVLSQPALERAPSSEEGVRALLKNVVHSPDRFRSTVAMLIGDIVVVDSIRVALRLRPIYPGWNFVTVDGDMLSADGVLTGGASEGLESGVLKRRREIKELSQRKDEMAGKLALSQASLKKIEEQFERIQIDLENAHKLRVEKEIRLTEVKKDLERAEIEVRNVNDSLGRQNNEFRDVETQYNKVQESLTNENSRLESFKSRKTELEAKTTALDEEYANANTNVGPMREVATQAKVDWAAKNQSIDGVRGQYEMLQNSLSDINSQLNRLKEDSNRNTSTMNEHQIRMEQEMIALNRLINSSEALRLELSQMRDQYHRESNEIYKRRESASSLQREANEKQMTMNDLHLRAEQLKMKVQYIQDHVREKYVLLIAEVAPKYLDRQYEASTVDAELEDLRDKLKKMGEVNLAAIQEYGEINERYEFLTKQEADLIEAKESLRKVIDRINRICNRRFKETFDAVNERFQKVFPVLFGGGQAELVGVIHEGDDEMGIDIVAKPPGKKLQNISLMSGGEKALTSVALIFSIFLVKPSPYCLLDEVDAPLDDANVFRFNDLVKEMAKRSQIIVVTHNKHTMEINDKLYGVTMQEKGVSKMVSVSLDEAQSVVANA